MLIGVIIAIILLVIILNLLFGISIKKLKQIKELSKSKELNEISNKFPDNNQICKSILKILNNEKVNIKVYENSKDKTSLYVIMTNTIFIANIKDTYTRIQTIAHECIHSVQDKKLLWFNFIFTNLYAIYFIVATILTLTGIIKDTNIQILALILFGFLQYIIRCYLEMDAMIKARFLAEKYMQDYIKDNNDNNNDNKCSKEEIDKICSGLDMINKNGIPMYIFGLFIKAVTKPLIYTIIVLIIK